MANAKREVTLVNPWGMHARSAMRFVQTALPFNAAVTVASPDVEAVDGKDVMSLLTLGASVGTLLVIEADGDDAEEVVSALALLVEEGFGEIDTKRAAHQ